MNKIGTIKIESNVTYESVATTCKICGEEIILRDYNNIVYDRFQICDKCKAAIMAMRKQLEERK